MDIKDLPINQVIEYKLESDAQPLTPEVIDKIVMELSAHYRKEYGVLSAFPTAAFVATLEWKWLTERGTLPKRIGAWWYARLEKKLDEEVITKLGNYAREAIPKGQVYHFDITDRLNWKQGDFGDHQSCYFNYTGQEGGNTPGETMQAMQGAGKFKAIRFFKPIPAHASIAGLNSFYTTDEKGYIGICRAFIYETEKTKKIGKESVEFPLKVIFNGYGMTTNKVASIFSSYLGASKKYVTFQSRSLYVNDNAYVVGDDSAIKDISDIRGPDKIIEEAYRHPQVHLGVFAPRDDYDD